MPPSCGRLSQRSVLRMWVAGLAIAPMRVPVAWQALQACGCRLEHAVRMAAFAARVAVCAGQLEAGRQVIEGRRAAARPMPAALASTAPSASSRLKSARLAMVLLRPRAVEGNRRVAAVAAPPELAQVHVVGRVAGRAVPPELRLARRSLMTGVALQAPVRAAQCEAALLLVVELPDVPGVRAVAARAVVAEVAAMHVIGPVAGGAAARVPRRTGASHGSGRREPRRAGRAAESPRRRDRSATSRFQAAVPWQFSQFLPCVPACTSTARWQATHCCAGLWSATLAVWQLWQPSVACAPVSVNLVSRSCTKCVVCHCVGSWQVSHLLPMRPRVRVDRQRRGSPALPRQLVFEAPAAMTGLAGGLPVRARAARSRSPSRGRTSRRSRRPACGSRRSRCRAGRGARHRAYGSWRRRWASPSSGCRHGRRRTESAHGAPAAGSGVFAWS